MFAGIKIALIFEVSKTKNMTNREKARELNLKINSQLKVMIQNKKATGRTYPFEYRRWLKQLMIERDRLWAIS